MASFSPSEKCYATDIYPEQERAMEKQFTASKVHRLSNRIPRSNDEIADAQEALRAFAYMLEAREKAVPVRQFRVFPKGSTWTEVKDDEIWATVTAHPVSYETRVLYTHSTQAQPPAASVPDIETMVNRFLSWRLPKPWNPDNGISYTRPNYAHEPAEHDWPTGTNLFDAHQAREMVEYMLAAQESRND